MSASYRDVLVSSTSSDGSKKDPKEASNLVAVGTASTATDDNLTSSSANPTSTGDVSKLSSSPDLDTKELPLIPSPKPDHYGVSGRRTRGQEEEEDANRVSPDSSAGSSFKKLPDSDDASDENGRRNGRSPASTTSDNDFDRGNLNNSDDAEDSEDVTEGPDTHPADDSVTDNVDADAIAREDRGPDELPPTVTVLDGQHGSKVYLIGTAHFSHESQRDVEETIRKVQPNVVVLELCESRLSILSINEEMLMKESGTLTMSKIQDNIKAQGMVQGIMYSLLLSLSAQLTRELGMAPGGEFRRAVSEAKKVPGCIIQLGDRPVDVTLRRAISSLSVWQKIKLGVSILTSKESITKEEVEKCKQKDLLEEMLKEITGEFPTLSSVFVAERDVYLTYSLQLASSSYRDVHEPEVVIPTKVVGVVGIGHVPGIVKNWGTVRDADIPELMRIPQQSLTTFLVIKSLKYSLSGLAIFGLYKLLVPRSLSRLASDTIFNVWQAAVKRLYVK